MVIVWVCGKNLKCDYTNESYWAVLPCVNLVFQGDSSNKCQMPTLWCLTYGWISCWQEDGKGRRQIDILIAKSDQNTATCATQLTVQHRIQNWIVALNILLK